MATKNIVPRADNEGSLGTSSKQWANIYCYDMAVADDLTVGDDLTVTGTVSAGTVGSDLIPSADNTYDLGSSSYMFANFFCKGAALLQGHALVIVVSASNYTAGSVSSTYAKIALKTEVVDRTSEFNTSTYVFTSTSGGYYLAIGTALAAGSAVSCVKLGIADSSEYHSQAIGTIPSSALVQVAVTTSCIVSLAAGGTLQLDIAGDVGEGAIAAGGIRFCIYQLA